MLQKLLTVTALTAVLTGGLVSDTNAARRDFVGTWINQNPNTRGITRIVIRRRGRRTLSVQVFGKCHPRDCNWGDTKLVTYGANVQDRNHTFATAVYNKQFARTFLNIRLGGRGYRRITVQSFTRFTDSSRRQNYAKREQFRRVRTRSSHSGDRYYSQY